jgi:hypothetical protein
VLKYIALSDEDFSALNDALRVAGVKYHGGKQFDRATFIRVLRRRITDKKNWEPKPGDQVLDLDQQFNFAIVKKLYTPDTTGRFAFADLYYPASNTEDLLVKTSSLMDARDVGARSSE